MSSTQDDVLTARMYGAENVDKYNRNKRDGPEETKRRFLSKYPYANIDKFMFGVSVDENADISSYNVMYIINTNPTRVVNIKYKEFLNNPEYVKDLNKDIQWESLWDVKGIVQPFKLNRDGAGFDMLKFRIYVDDDEFFESNFEKYIIKDTDKITSDLEPNTYVTALTAAYIATYACSICTKHFEFNDKIPKIITSIARYHLYYIIKRFLRSPDKMKRFVTNDMNTLIQRNKPVRYNWVHDFYQGKEDAGTWERTQPRGTVRNVKPVIKSGFGQIGLNYERRTNRTNNGGYNDFWLFIATETNGLTKTGQLLLQQSIESCVYSVLGAQASTRWSIVGNGAMSIQTQEVFHQKVKDTIIQDDQVVNINNMRKAIADTNVVLNLAVSPGVILIPSSLIILTDKIPGYNNVLLLASKSMKFGKNDDVNYFVDRTESSSSALPFGGASALPRNRLSDTSTSISTSLSDNQSQRITQLVSKNPYDNTVTSLATLSTVLGVMIARYLI